MDDEIKTILLWLFIAGPLISYFSVGFLMFLFSFKESLGNPLFILIILSMGGGGVALLPMMAMQGDMSNELIITLGWCLYGVYKVYGEKSG
jgi:hypothetical protein